MNSKIAPENGMQRKGMFAVALVFCLASHAQAALTINVGAHSFPPGSGVVVIPITVSGTDPVHGTDLVVQLGGSSSAVAALGAAPPITYQGSEQYNIPTPGTGAALLTPSMWDAHASTWSDSTNGLNDVIPTIPGSPGYGAAGKEGTWFYGTLVFKSITVSAGQVVPNGLAEVNLKVNLTGFGPGTWPLLLRGGQAGATDFIDSNAAIVPVTIVDGSVTVTPEPTSVVLGLFAAAGLGIVAIRKRRAPVV